MPRELSYDWDKLVKIVKQDDEITQRAAAEKLGVSPSSLSILNFCQAKVEAGVESTAPATARATAGR
jgi:DNA-binding transcriptional regulator YdaS (Cro superfamily)